MNAYIFSCNLQSNLTLVTFFEVFYEVQVLKKYHKNTQLVSDHFCEINREQGFKFTIQSLLLSQTHHKSLSKILQVGTLVSQGRLVEIRPEKPVLPLIQSIISFSMGISKMTLAIPCGLGDWAKKRHLTKGNCYSSSKNIYKLFCTVLLLFHRHHLY